MCNISYWNDLLLNKEFFVKKKSISYVLFLKSINEYYIESSDLRRNECASMYVYIGIRCISHSSNPDMFGAYMYHCYLCQNRNKRIFLR